MKQKKSSLIRKILLGLLAVLLACCLAFGVYVSDYYHADPEAWDALSSDDRVTVTEQDGSWVFAPASPTAGLIFCLISAAQRQTPGDLERISGGPSAYSTLDQRFFVTSRISFIWFASASKILPASSSSCPDTAFASSIRFVFSKHFTFSRSWLQRYLSAFALL